MGSELTRQKRWLLRNPEYQLQYYRKNQAKRNAQNLKWMSENRDKMRKSYSKFHASRREWINSLKDRPCTDCGGRFPPVAMHFDHREPKEKYRSISQMHTHSKERIIREVAKCDIVCANCHAVRTYRGIHSGKISIFGW